MKCGSNTKPAFVQIESGKWLYLFTLSGPGTSGSSTTGLEEFNNLHLKPTSQTGVLTARLPSCSRWKRQPKAMFWCLLTDVMDGGCVLAALAMSLKVKIDELCQNSNVHFVFSCKNLNTVSSNTDLRV